jgi:hypothetical protein
VIKVVTGADVLASARAGLGLPSDDGSANDIYIAASLRRLAGFLCPCSPRTLLRAMVETHRGLVSKDGSFAERVENIVEALVAMGDLLELSDVATLDETVKGTWVFAAPPAFVPRPSGSVFLLGLSADEATPLPADLRQRVSYQGIARWLEATPDEDLVSTLRDLGLNELSLERWSRPPRAQSASGLIAEMNGKLAAQSPCSEIADLRVLDHTRNVRRYRDRWTIPAAQQGRFIVRRPQAYGADLWGYAELAEGRPVKLIDFPMPGSRWRGCDSAWRLQMAIDAEAGKAQTYILHEKSDAARLEFFVPIPDWGRRRLAAIGEEVAPSGSLLAYILPKREVAAEEEFLRNYLFLKRAGA